MPINIVTNDLDNLIDSRNDNGCRRIVITPQNIYPILSTMHLNKGSGYDGVALLFLRECSEILCGSLSRIYRIKQKESGSYVLSSYIERCQKYDLLTLFKYM